MASLIQSIKTALRSRVVIALLLICIVLLALVDSNNIARYVTHIIQGNSVSWRDLEIDIAEGFFVFPKYNNEFIMFGKIDSREKAFPDDNILMLINCSVEHCEELIRKLRDVCNLKTNCFNYKQYEYPVASEGLTECISFDADFDSWGNKPFHVYCYSTKREHLIEFHGHRDAFEHFKKQIDELGVSV